jgi:hypothetical protein
MPLFRLKIKQEIMATKRKTKTKERFFSFIPSLQPLSKEEKEELKMRIVVAIRQSVATN